MVTVRWIATTSARHHWHVAPAHAVASPTPGQVSHLQRGRVAPLAFAALRGRCPSVCALFIRDARGVATYPLQAVGTVGRMET